MQENTYPIDVNSSVESARLLYQDRVLTREMQGLGLKDLGLSAHRVLDLACGPGGWVLEVAFDNPEIEVLGVDISEQMIVYARTQAGEQGLENASFQRMNILQPLPFPDAAFDVVNARLIFSFMTPATWPALLRECFRILRTGGVVRLTECELPITSSAALTASELMTVQALQKSGQISSSDRVHLGATIELAPLLKSCGYTEVRNKAYAIDFSAQTGSHQTLCQTFTSGMILIRPFLAKMGLSVQEFNALCEQATSDMRSETFKALWFYVSVLGTKP